MWPDALLHETTPASPVKIAILAMGGEGGGVLADWIVDAAEHEGYYAQSTSVPGVAQRTGATIYYVEILAVARTPGRAPVFSLMPTPGDVDVVIASELMEAARAVQRGLVTEDRTLLITSSHRVYAMPEKMALDDGRVPSDSLMESGRKAARRFVARDFQQLAQAQASVISAALCGALAASKALPLAPEAFEAAIRRGGVGVASSLKAFTSGMQAFEAEGPDGTAVPERTPDRSDDPRLSALMQRVQRDFAPSIAPTVTLGVLRTADYQDVAYAGEYLDRLAPIARLDRELGSHDLTLSREVARTLALWMTFEDTARVAELKLRTSRFHRIEDELRAGSGQLVQIHDYFHPRLQEIADMLPRGAGRWLVSSPLARATLGRLTQTGRVLQTSALSGFVLLYAVAACRGLRRRSWRYQRETAEIRQWLSRVSRAAPQDYELACEIVQCQMLIKGYGDTHERGMHRYRAIMERLDAEPAPSAGLVRRLRSAALADESGDELHAVMGPRAVAASAGGVR